ncbi:tetratricopeptide repeat protein [Massilia sp. CF038]|uniref:tetratricopeptide repeat protein n=1 Tax=Massilia sp. CF038 TaxID=1881045 RepID=UPI000934B91A|nr:tetratricopeptide repeat protein [Massilia sp. CF038]
MKAKKYADAEKAAAAVLAQDPGNAEAMANRTDAILASGRSARIEEAIKQAQQCVNAKAADARCQLALGKALGAKAMNGGMLSAMGYASDIRNAFKKAVDLDPRNLDARFSLLQYYLMAPGIVGGGTGKAENLAAQTVTIYPEAAKLMQARIDIAGDRLAKAEATALSVRASSDDELAEQQLGVLAAVAFKHLSQKRVGEAERIFNDAAKRFPDSDDVAYGQARVFQEQGKHREALAILEAALAKDDRSHVHYRIAKSLQALGEKARAKAEYEKALSFKADLPPNMKNDSEEQLRVLKG